MEILYESKKLEELFQDHTKLSAKVDFHLLKIIKKRQLELMAADTFFDYLHIGLGRPHLLTGELHGYYATRLDANKRLIFKPIYEKNQKDCSKVVIKGVIDYHGSKTTIYLP